MIVNFKSYKESIGKNAENLLKEFSGVKKPENCDVVYSLNPLDLCLKEKFKESNLISQHVDTFPPGAHTGKLPMELLIEKGISGSLLNHSEYRADPSTIVETIKRSREVGFDIVLCVESEEEAEKYAPLKPRFIAYEPPELIGGDVSVTTANPGIIENVVKICDKFGVEVLVGAGVKNSKDLKKSLELGAKGVLIASGIVKSHDPLYSLNSLIQNVLG